MNLALFVLVMADQSKRKSERLRKHQGSFTSFYPNVASAEFPVDCRIARRMHVLTVICPPAAARNQIFICSKILLGRYS